MKPASSITRTIDARERPDKGAKDGGPGRYASAKMSMLLADEK
jgi:hypothetical protein